MLSKNLLRVLGASVVAASVMSVSLPGVGAEFIASKNLHSPITKSGGPRADLYCPWGYHQKGEWYHSSYRGWSHKPVELNKWQSNNCEKNRKHRWKRKRGGWHSSN